jgi:hypothetical protein
LFKNWSHQIAKTFRNHGMTLKDLHTGLDDTSLEIPFIIIDHTSYPGVEAHLFTAAHVALWNAQFTNEHDVIISYPVINPEVKKQVGFNELKVQAWGRLTFGLSTIMDSMKLYKKNITNGEFATVIWGHHATEWHRELWESRVHEHVSPSEFIDYVDNSIRPHIMELNDLGFATIESCSGLLADHPDRVPYKPYVMFDERSYFGSAPHFFTLGDMAGWESMYAPHGFDVYIRVFAGDDIEAAWSRLIVMARILSSLLSEYRKHCARNGLLVLSRDRLSYDGNDDSTKYITNGKIRKTLDLNEIQ